MDCCKILLVAIVVALTNQSALGVEYWPMQDDIIYYYQNDEGTTLTVTFDGNTRECVYATEWGATGCTTWESFSIDGEGDLLLGGITEYCTGAIDPNYMWTFSPWVKFLDLPLEVGKVWGTATIASGYGTYPTALIYEVESATTVQVPYGSFDVLVVTESGGFADHYGTYYLNESVGPVILPGGFELVGLNGIVATDEVSWDAVKAIYR